MNFYISSKALFKRVVYWFYFSLPIQVSRSPEDIIQALSIVRLDIKLREMLLFIHITYFDCAYHTTESQ